ncbi:MAG: methyltransferase domain-containing protein [Arachidicoccus sp.]|nr:methyltransferase domain-containing protein [Arachidicoccus sp.]
MMQLKLFAEKFLPGSVLKAAKNTYRTLRGIIKSKAYKGDEVYCPCCNKHFSHFADFKYSLELTNSKRFKDTYKNIDCPYCYSHPRHRIVCFSLNHIKEKLKKNNVTALMIGAEYSIEKWFRDNQINFITTDLFDKTADIKADIQNMPFDNNSQSLIICNHVLEHVPNVKVALKELYRILSQDGILEISVPTDKSFSHTIENTGELSVNERIEKFGQIDHMRIFGNDVEEIIRSACFSVEIIDGEKLPENIVAKIGPANYDDNRIYVCRKTQ